MCPSASYAVARARFKESLELVSTAHLRAGARPASAARRAAARASFFSSRFSLVCALLRLCVRREGLLSRPDRRASMSTLCDKPIDTLGGGSLGSCVDEERSQLR